MIFTLRNGLMTLVTHDTRDHLKICPKLYFWWSRTAEKKFSEQDSWTAMAAPYFCSAFLKDANCGT